MCYLAEYLVSPPVVSCTDTQKYIPVHETGITFIISTHLLYVSINNIHIYYVSLIIQTNLVMFINLVKQ